MTHIKDYTGRRAHLIGIGGSATNDGGLGMAQALGYRFYDADDRLFIHDMSKAGEL